MIVCSLVIILMPGTAMASPGHGTGILPDDSAHEAPQPDDAEAEAPTTEDHAGDDTTEAPSESSATEDADDDHESTATAEDTAKTTAAQPEPAEKETHNDPGEHYSVNSADANGYAVAIGITLGVVGLFGLALRYQ